MALCYLPWLLIALAHVNEQSDVLAWFIDYWKAKSLVGHFMTSIGTFVPRRLSPPTWPSRAPYRQRRSSEVAPCC